MSDTNQDPFSEFGGKAVKASNSNDPFSEFGGKSLKKKESSESTSTTQEPSGGSVQTNGSSDFPLPKSATELVIEQQGKNITPANKSIIADPKIVKQNEADDKIVKSIFTIDQNKIDQALQSEADDNEVSDYLREGGKNVLNVLGGIANIFPKTVNAISGGTLDLPTYEPFEKKVPFEQATKKVNEQIAEIKKKDPKFTITPEEFKAKVKEAFVEDEKQKQINENAVAVLSDTDPEVQKRIKSKIINGIKNLDNNQKAISVQIQSLDNNATAKRQEITALKNKIDSDNASPQDIEDYNNKLETYKVLEKAYFGLLNRKEKYSTDKLSAQEQLQLFSLDYNPYSKAVDDLTSPTAKMLGEGLYFLGKASDKLSELPIVGDDRKEKSEKSVFTKAGDSLIQASEEVTARHPQIHFTDIDGIGKFGGWTAQTIGNVFPFVAGTAIGTTEEQMIAKSFLTPSKALGGFSAVSAGSAMNEMDREMANNPDLNYNNWQYSAKILGNVASNAVMFGNYGAMMRGSNPLMQSIMNNPETKEEFTMGVKDYLNKAFDVAKKTNKSGAVMMGAQGINMFVDNHILGRKHEDGFSELADAYIEGAAMHGLISELPNLGAYMLGKVTSKSTKKDIDTNVLKIQSLEKELTNPNLTEAERVGVKAKIDQVNKENEALLLKVNEQVKSMPKESVEKLLEIDQDKFEIEKDVVEIKESNYSDEYKKAELLEKKKEYQELNNKQEAIFNEEPTESTTETKSEAEKVDSEIADLDRYNQKLLDNENSYDWEKELAKEYFADKRKYIERTLATAEKNLKEDPESGFDKFSAERAKKGLKELDEQEAKSEKIAQKTPSAEKAEPIQESAKVESEEMVNDKEVFSVDNKIYEESFLNKGDEDINTFKEYGKNSIKQTIDEVKKLEFPLKIYRGVEGEVDNINVVPENKFIDGSSWTTDIGVAKKFGKNIYEKTINKDDVDFESTISRRILHSSQNESEINLKTPKNEATPSRDTPTDGNLRSRTNSLGENGNFEQKNNIPESVPSAVDGSEAKGDTKVDAEKAKIDFAKDQIEKGVTQWSGDISQARIDLGLSWADIRKGEADLQRGKENSVPAKRLVEALDKARQEGGYHYKFGTGGESQRAKEFVSLEDMQRSVNQDRLTDAEIEEINKNAESLAKEYEEHFNSLDESTQTEIRENYENKPTTESRVPEKLAKRGESKDDVSDKEKSSAKSTGKIPEKKVIEFDINDVAEFLNQEFKNIPKESEKFSDQVRKLKIDLSKLSDGGLQSNPLGLPVAVWNTSMDIIAKSIDAGVEIGEAIKRGLNYIQKNHRGAWDKKAFNDNVLKELGVRGIEVNGKDIIVKEQSKENAKVVDGFYSDIEKSLIDTKKDNLTASEWETIIGKSDEAKWTGLTDFINSKEGRVSKTEIKEYLDNNRIEIVEVVKGKTEWNEVKKDKWERPIDKTNPSGKKTSGKVVIKLIEGKYYGEPSTTKYTHTFNSLEEAKNYYDGVDGFSTDTKFSQYQLEGEKENYKEVLVTMPKKQIENKYEVRTLDSKYAIWNNETNSFDDLAKGLTKEEAESRIRRIGKNTIREDTFKSSHFDEQNILVHLRMNTRTDAEGKKVLFLEEVQSDWGQKGKKEGFIQKEIPIPENLPDGFYTKKDGDGNIRLYTPKGIMYGDSFSSDKQVIEWFYKKANYSEYENKGKHPTAPFVTDTNSWAKLGVKVALKEAVKQGADKLSWTTGEQQNDRYDLSKSVNKVTSRSGKDVKYVEIDAKSGSVSLEVDNNGKILKSESDESFGQDSFVGTNLSDVIGKEVADKIMSSDKVDLSSEGLKVGGKGMKGFYGSPSEGKLGIIGEVVKALTKQEPKTVELNKGKDEKLKAYQYDGTQDVSGMMGADYLKNGDWIVETPSGFQMSIEAKSKEEAIIEFRNAAEDTQSNVGEYSQSTQHSIEITPELKAEVEKGLPMFGNLKEQQKAMVNAEVDRIAQKVKDFLPSAKGADGLMRQGFSQDQIIDLVADAVKALVSKGIDVNEAIKQVIEKLKGKFGDLGIEPKDVFDKHFAPKEEPIVVDGKEYTSLKKAVYDAERQAEGKEVINTTNPKTPKEVRSEVEAKIKSGEITESEIRDIASALASKQDIATKLSGEEIEYALLHDKVTLRKESRQIDTELEKAMAENNQESIDDLVFRKAQNTLLKGENYRAAKTTGSGASRIMNAKKAGLDEDYSYEAIQDRINEITEGKELSPDAKKKLEGLTNQITDLQTKLDEYQSKFDEFEKENQKLSKEKAELEEVIAKGKAEEKLERLKKLKDKTNYKKADIEKRKIAKIEEIRAKYKRLSGTLNAGVNPKLLELAPEISALARIYIQEGVVALEDLIGRIMIDLDIPELDERTVRDLFSGYGKSVKLTEDPELITLSQLKSKARAISGLEDVKELGIPPAKSGLKHREPTEEVKAIRREITEEMRRQGIDIKNSKNPDDVWKTALQSYKTRIKNRIEYLETIQKTKDVERFIREKQRVKLKLDQEARDLKKQQQLLKNQVDDMVKRYDFEQWSNFRKGLNYTSRFTRGVLISSPVTLAKIIGAATWRATYKPLLAVSTYGSTKLSKTASQYEGIHTLPDLAEHLGTYYAELFSKKNFQEFKETFKNHKTSEDILLGKYRGEDIIPKVKVKGVKTALQASFFWSLRVLDKNGALHGSLKNFVSRPEYEAYRKTILKNLIKEGVDPQTFEQPTLQAVADQMAFQKGLQARFMQDNIISSSQKMFEGYLEGKGRNAEKELLNMAFPIVKIGSNYVTESLEKLPVVGLTMNAKPLFKLMFDKGNMTPQQKSNVLRALSYQGVGLASYMVGMYAYQSISPFYGTNAKKYAQKNGRDNSDEDEDLGFLNHTFTHSPEAVMMKAGASHMWLWDQYDKEHPGEKSMLTFMSQMFQQGLENVPAITAQSPYISGSESVLAPLITPGHDIGKAGANFVRGRVPGGDVLKSISQGKVPFLSKVSHGLGKVVGDKLRMKEETVKPYEIGIYPKGFIDNILIGIPGWRDDVLNRLYEEKYGIKSKIKDVDQMIDALEHKGEKELKKMQFQQEHSKN